MHSTLEELWAKEGETPNRLCFLVARQLSGIAGFQCLFGKKWLCTMEILDREMRLKAFNLHEYGEPAAYAQRKIPQYD